MIAYDPDDRERAARRLVELVTHRFRDVDCVDGLDQLREEGERIVFRMVTEVAPETLVRLVAGLDLWAVRARAHGESWDWRGETLAEWLATRPDAWVWVSGEEPPREVIATWLAGRIRADG